MLYFLYMELLVALAIALGVNILMFIPAYIFKTDKLTDISYGVSFILVSAIVLWYSPKDVTLGQLILLGMITLWGLRIATYLFIRINKIGRDKRFDGMREYFFKFLKFWLLQGLSVWVVLLASIQYFLLDITPIGIIGAIGIALWAMGLLIETVADYQKYTFINNPNNAGKWIEKGLWKYSRHPNYFGEILHWIGVYVYTLPAIGGYMYLVGAISPLYIALLIIFVSGIPMLERAANERWGSDPAYHGYKQRTPVLIPFLHTGWKK